MRISVEYFYITHLGVRYKIYPFSLSFDLRCQSGVLPHISLLHNIIYYVIDI